MKNIKKRVHNLLLPGIKHDAGSWFVEAVLVTLIVTNITSLLLETVPALHQSYHHIFYYIEVFSVVVFSIEYVLRVWSITEVPAYAHPVKGRIRYMLSFMAVCDILSIIPFYMPFVYADLAVLRLFRFLRLLRIFKVARYLTALTTIRKVVHDKRGELLVSLVLMLFVLIITSTLMFHIENSYQPDKFSSIPATMWWGITTLTTIGYGDMVPITSLGKFFGGVITMIGVGLFALPAGIIASGFHENVGKKKKANTCPHCGNELTA